MKISYPTLARWILAAVFGYAGWQKVKEPAAFADSVAAYQLLGPVSISLAAIALPTLELLTAVLLIINRPRRLGTVAAAAMTALFTVSLASVLARGLQIDCGCFGSGKAAPTSTWPAFARALLLFAIATALYLFELLKRSPESPTAGISNPASDVRIEK
ncbi:MAG: DoxX family protein [Chthoniobacteraceae bacterium]|nr:DoxX family protein [Chthoniobacteraceae bacterium]